MHTPGPWSVTETPPNSTVRPNQLLVTSRHHDVAIVLRDDAPARRANAWLLAAAPELLEELRALVERCDGAEGVRADGSNIDTRSAHALLERLGD